jgi:ferredoxin
VTSCGKDTAATGPAGVTHWSSRLLAGEMGLSNVKVAKVWREWGLQPWRTESFKFSTDPELEATVRDVVGLYLDSLDEAVVLCVDDKPQTRRWSGPRRCGRCARGCPKSAATTTSGAWHNPARSEGDPGLGGTAPGGPDACQGGTSRSWLAGPRGPVGAAQPWTLRTLNTGAGPCPRRRARAADGDVSGQHPLPPVQGGAGSSVLF